MSRLLSFFILLLLLLPSYGCLNNMDLGKGLSAAADAYKSLTLSDAEVIDLGRKTAAEMDSANKLAASNSKYVQRLNKITKDMTKEDGLTLNFKVYLTDEINAFALPDGSVRVYSGLMDIMTDNELFFVIGHEIGHVKEGHTFNRFKMAYASSAARKAADAAGGVASALSKSQLGDLGETVLHAQFSQAQETSADEYGLKLVQKYKKPNSAAISALNKLAALSGANSSNILSSHPDSAKRAAHLQGILDRQSKGK